MAKKLSELVREAGQKFYQTTGRLYSNSPSPDKKCSVCALGGIALLGAPERFITKKTSGGQVEIYDTDTCMGEISTFLPYSHIMEAVGITDDKILHRGEYEAHKGNYTVKDNCLTHFIYRMNDGGFTFEEIAAALEKYGL